MFNLLYTYMKKSIRFTSIAIVATFLVAFIAYADQIYSGLIVKGSPWYDIRAYSSISDAVTAIGSSEKTLLVFGNVPVSTDTTLPTTMHVWYLGSGKFTIASGKVLTHNASITAGNHIIWVGPGTIVPPKQTINLNWVGSLANAVALLTTATCEVEITKPYVQSVDVTTPSTMSISFKSPGQVSVDVTKTWTISGHIYGRDGCFQGNGKVIPSTLQLNASEWWPSFEKAISDIGNNARSLSVSTTKVISGDLTVPATIELLVFSGGSLQPAGGTTTTLNCSFFGDTTKAFGGSGTIVLTRSATYQVSTEAQLIASKDAKNIEVVNSLSLSANLTTTCNLSIVKGSIITTTGYTLTISGPFEAGPYQVFAGTGTVVFGPAVIEGVRPEWFGAVGDDSTDCTAAFVEAEACAFASGKPLLLSGIYRVTATSGNYAVSCRVGMKGVGPNASVIKNMGTGSALKLYGVTSSNYYNRFENFRVQGNASSEDGISLNPDAASGAEVAYASFHKVESYNHGRHGLYHRSSWGVKYTDCKFFNNGYLGVYLYPDAGYYHNNITFTNCEARHNGGTGNNTGVYQKGGVAVGGGVAGFYWIGGIVESNNAWGFILGNDTGATAYQLKIQNVYMENNPAITGASTIGGNFIVSQKYSNVEVSGCWGTYGAEAGATGYGFYIVDAAEAGSYFKEYNNYFSDVGAGTNVRSYGLTYDWTTPLVSRGLGAGTTTLAITNGTGGWYLSGYIHIRPMGYDHYGRYPFWAGYDSSAGWSCRVGSNTLVNQNGGVSSAISTGGTIAHGLGVAPDSISITPAVTGPTGVYATADATNITVNFGGGGSYAFNWAATNYRGSPVLTAPTLSWDSGSLKIVIATNHYAYVEMMLGTPNGPPDAFSLPATVWSDVARRK